MKNDNKIMELTKAELDVMQILWDLEQGMVNDIIEQMAEPKPAYNTVSTFVRILEKKGFVDHKQFGRSHLYFPLIGREQYTHGFMRGVLNTFFDSSLPQMVSFFASEEKISLKEMDEIMEILSKKR